MRWNVNEVKEPENGETRSKRKFAWKKTRIKDKWVWLEFYWQNERYYRAVIWARVVER